MDLEQVDFESTGATIFSNGNLSSSNRQNSDAPIASQVISPLSISHSHEFVNSNTKSQDASSVNVMGVNPEFTSQEQLLLEIQSDTSSSSNSKKSKRRNKKMSFSQLICDSAPASDGQVTVNADCIDEAIENNESDIQITSLTDVTAFLNMANNQANIGEVDSNMRLLDGIDSNGIIQLVDSNGRLFCITTSESDPSTSIAPLTNPVPAIESYPLDNMVVTADLHTSEINQNVNGVTDGQFKEINTTEQVSTDNLQQTPKSRKKRQKKARVPEERKGKGGWPKGRKRKVNEYRIKAPASAYLIFAKKRRKEIMDKYPYYSFSEVTKIMGKEWTEMDFNLKDDYNRRADEDKKRFRDELKAYQQSQEYQNILKRKKEERYKDGRTLGADLEDTMDEELMLYCRICDQRFSNRHNRAEHLAGRVHLNNLQTELRKENKQAAEDSADKLESQCNETLCCHCSKKSSSLSGDSSLDINSMMETFIYKHGQRESEIQMLKDNLESLKEISSQFSKQLISLQDKQVKLKQDIQTMSQTHDQLNRDIDNLKMVPTLYGVINF